MSMMMSVRRLSMLPALLLGLGFFFPPAAHAEELIPVRGAVAENGLCGEEACLIAPEDAQIRVFGVQEREFSPELKDTTNPLKAPDSGQATLESSARAGYPPSGPRYSSSMRFVFNNTDKPLADMLYFFETADGTAVLGRTGEDGYTARLYYPRKESFYWYRGSEALFASQGLASASESNLYSSNANADASGNEPAAPWTPQGKRIEKACFVYRLSGEPVVNYPYFIQTASGAAVSGLTDKKGCSPKVYAPETRQFTVYGGKEAMTMGEFEPLENRPPAPGPADTPQSPAPAGSPAENASAAPALIRPPASSDNATRPDPALPPTESAPAPAAATEPAPRTMPNYDLVANHAEIAARIHAYVRNTRGWPKESYYLRYEPDKSNADVLVCTVINLEDENPDTYRPGNGKSFQVWMDLRDLHIMQEFLYEQTPFLSK